MSRVAFLCAALAVFCLCPTLGRPTGFQGRRLAQVAPAPAPGPDMAVGGSEIPLTWDLGLTYEDMAATVGDTVVFSWGGGAPHGVFRIPDGNCPAEYVSSPPTSVEVGPVSGEGEASFTFEEPGDYWFACQVGSHCAQGMLVKFTVA